VQVFARLSTIRFLFSTLQQKDAQPNAVIIFYRRYLLQFYIIKQATHNILNRNTMILIERMNFKKLLIAIALKTTIAIAVLIYSKKIVITKAVEKTPETLCCLQQELLLNKNRMTDCLLSI
jgi:hypothetical protein